MYRLLDSRQHGKETLPAPWFSHGLENKNMFMWINRVRKTSNTFRTFCYWWAPWESEGRNGPDCSGHGSAAVFSVLTRSSSRWTSSAALSTTIQGDPCSAVASCPVTWGWPLPNVGALEARVAQEQNIPGEGFLPYVMHTKCKTKQRHFTANKAQIYCCNSLGRWQSDEESFCSLPILVGVGVDFQQGDHSTWPTDSNPCTHLRGTCTQIYCG